MKYIFILNLLAAIYCFYVGYGIRNKPMAKIILFLLGAINAGFAIDGILKLLS